ncbi:hypothetical protein PPYR_01991 [Photinus pyralis]|uniref:EGF-like domain-containing protein n=1 Tax=Photinus pyralis TaxID=7054 RepID=A0A1Y1N6B1_PHOPY|nr:uncharacterized protein LOC116180205 [Photinus pyralis]KAB0805021.1 hypothetical protein PPYR_01991 [Photinus pyralis]
MVTVSYLDLSVILLFILHSSLGKQACDSSSIIEKQCHETFLCVPTNDSTNNGYCECLPGYTKINETYCTNASDATTAKSSSLVNKEEDNGSGHVVAGILIPVFLIMVVIAGIYFNRKYHLADYFISKLYQRNSNYDEVMIGQDLEDDDPPLR